MFGCSEKMLFNEGFSSLPSKDFGGHLCLNPVHKKERYAKVGKDDGSEWKDNNQKVFRKKKRLWPSFYCRKPITEHRSPKTRTRHKRYRIGISISVSLADAEATSITACISSANCERLNRTNASHMKINGNRRKLGVLIEIRCNSRVDGFCIPG